MSATRRPGKVNEHTTLIDVGMYGLAGSAAVYLIEGRDKRCLIDAGTGTEAPRVLDALEALRAFPPDLIIVTHAHRDHAQGVPLLRREAGKRGHEVAVLASPKAIPLLADPTYNAILGDGAYESIQDVTTVADGDTVDLGGITLEILEAPGHSVEHIAVLDRENRNLLLGDAIGLKLGDDTFLPPFMPPLWDPDAFQSTIDKLKQTDYDSLCLAHYGCIYGDEAKSIPDDALRVTERWWRLFTDHEQRLDDADNIFELVMNAIGPGIPDLRVLHPATGEASGELFLRGLIAKLALGYRLAERTARAEMTQMGVGSTGNV